MYLKPDVLLHLEDDDGVCACHLGVGSGLTKIVPPMSVVEGTLVIQLPEYKAVARLPDANEISAVRVHVRGTKVSVYPIYFDPLKTATAVAADGTGCTCYVWGSVHSLKTKGMKRLHVHVAVTDLSQSIEFYSALFATPPTVLKPDYAKWMLDDPRVNFAISARGREPGLDHLGIQVESQDELREVYSRLRRAGGDIIEQGQTACCYAKSDKSWIDDPTGISWEAFYTSGEITNYGDGTGERAPRLARTKEAAACCAAEAT